MAAVEFIVRGALLQWRCALLSGYQFSSAPRYIATFHRENYILCLRHCGILLGDPGTWIYLGHGGPGGLRRLQDVPQPASRKLLAVLRGGYLQRQPLFVSRCWIAIGRFGVIGHRPPRNQSAAAVFAGHPLSPPIAQCSGCQLHARHSLLLHGRLKHKFSRNGRFFLSAGATPARPAVQIYRDGVLWQDQGGIQLLTGTISQVSHHVFCCSCCSMQGSPSAPVSCSPSNRPP